MLHGRHFWREAGGWGAWPWGTAHTVADVSLTRKVDRFTFCWGAWKKWKSERVANDLSSLLLMKMSGHLASSSLTHPKGRVCLASGPSRGHPHPLLKNSLSSVPFYHLLSRLISPLSVISFPEIYSVFSSTIDVFTSHYIIIFFVYHNPLPFLISYNNSCDICILPTFIMKTFG